MKLTRRSEDGRRTWMRRLLDSGRGVSGPQWAKRHHVVLLSLVVYLPAIAMLSVAASIPIDVASTYLLVVVILAVLALSPKVAPSVRQILAAGSVLTANVSLIAASESAVYAQFGFAFVAVLITLYQSWSVQLYTWGYIAFFYLVLGLRFPDLVYPEGIDPTTVTGWSLTFFAASVLTSIPGVAAWTLGAASAAENEALKVALAEAALRERQAAELNDTVVQDLVTAMYAAEEGDQTAAKASTERAIASARSLIDSLLSAGTTSAGELVRDRGAQAAQEHPAAAGDERGDDS